MVGKGSSETKVLRRSVLILAGETEKSSEVTSWRGTPRFTYSGADNVLSVPEKEGN